MLWKWAQKFTQNSSLTIIFSQVFIFACIFCSFILLETGKRITDEVLPVLSKEKPAPSYDAIQAKAVEEALKTESLFSRSKPPVKSSSMSIETEIVKNKSITSTPVTNKQSTWMSQPTVQKKQTKNTALEKLWTDKYAPSNIGEVIGNQDLVRNLMTWLKDWYSFSYSPC